MKIRLNIDTQRLQAKPKVFDGRLRTRLCNAASIREVEPAALLQAVQEGRAFTPAVMTGTTGDTWQEQQVICADIDNDSGKKDAAGNKIRIENPITPDRAADIMREYGIDPFFMYYSFSNAEGWPKFRIVLILDAPLTDPAEARDLEARFTGIFNRAELRSADTTNSDSARLYYGSRHDSVFYYSGQTTSRALLSALPESPEKPTEEPKRPNIAPKPKPAQKITPAAGNAEKRTFDELQAQLRADIEGFDLAGYVMATTPSRPVMRGRSLFFNPCPICGHNDDFQVTGSLYHCHSASGGTGGSIIDYLINWEEIGRAEALEKFKYEIMRYDRDEWKQAYKEMKRAEEAAERRAAFTGPQVEIDPAAYDMTEEEIQAALDAEAAEYEEYLQTTEGQVEAAETAEYWANQPAGGADPGEQPPEEPEKDKLQAFFEKIQTEAYKPHETGLQFFDNLLGGVMQQSLLTVMAPPSVGKTTLCQEIAEEMAERGTRVIYLTFEMSYEQMIAKTLSYRLAKKGQRVTADEILKGYCLTETQRERVTRAYNEYREGPAKFIDYEEQKPTLDGLREYLTKTGKAAKAKGEPAPALVADYLQLITGEGDNEAKTVKAAITALKDYAKDYNTFVICIVAVNRGSYQRITLDSGRDSSGIEYTGDYVLSLQYYDIDQEAQDRWTPEDLGRLQREPWRRLIIRVLKHRLGAGQGRSAKVYCNAAYNYFVGETQPLPEWPKKELASRGQFKEKPPELPKATTPKKSGKMKKEELDAAAEEWNYLDEDEIPPFTGQT